MVKNDPQTRFFEFLRKSDHQICLEMVWNDSTDGPLTFY